MVLEKEKSLNFKVILAFFAMVVGMFMAILDIQIVASSLSVIASGLSASNDELSWIQTSYLISEVIIIPITGFASRLLSTRISYVIAATGFTIMSFLCSVSWNIESMIIFRALQGFFGGAMIPTTFGIIFIIFPKKLHTKVGMIIGLVVTVAPTIGPTLGGYITELVSWRFMFLINIIPGIFVCIIVFLYADFDKPNYSLLKNFDLKGMILMTSALGSLQYILEEGAKHDWFESNNITFFTLVTIFSFVSLIYRELTCDNPIIDLSTFKNKNFTFGCFFSFILGVGLYGSVYLLPLFLFKIAGYNTLQIGVTMIITGLFQFVSAPLAANMVERGVDKRFVLMMGFWLFALGCYLNSFLTAESEYVAMFVPQMIRGLALMFCFIPINDLALSKIPKADVPNASGLYNLTRNLGGAVGLALINSMITSNSKELIDSINYNLSINSSKFQESLAIYQSIFTGKVTNPEIASYQIINQIIERESFIIAINNVFVIIALLFLVGSLMIPFASQIKKSS